MPRDTIPQDFIDHLKSLGFKVYMRDRDSSYLIYEKPGVGVAYAQYRPFEGIQLVTVHKPHKEIGSGYHTDTPDLTEQTLLSAITLVQPHWDRHSSTPVKYKDMEEYRAANAFNAGYEEV